MVMKAFRTVDSRQSAFTAFNENILLEKLKRGWGDCQYLKNKADVCWAIKNVLISAYMQLSQQVIELIVHDLKKSTVSRGEKKKDEWKCKTKQTEKKPLCPSDVTKAKMHCDHFCNLKWSN